jgi:LCP family protein required for cell wall assembly
VDGGEPAGATVPNEAGLRALGARVDAAGAASAPPGRKHRRRRRRWSRRRKVLTALSVLVVLAVLVVAGGYGYARYRYDQIPKVHIKSEKPQISGQPFNMLVIGSDSRSGLAPGEQSQAGNAAEVGGQRSDVVMIWHIDPATRQISIVSIPRDTLVSMVGANVDEEGRFNRINSAFNSGVDGLVQTIEQNFGIPINHVMQVDFAGFQGAVDAMGGIHLDFPYPAKDAWSALNIPSAGCQLLNGTQALAVARSRHYEYYEDGYWHSDPSSDFGRIQRQDAFLRALIDEAKSKYNPLTLNALIGSIPQGIVIDDQLTLNDLIGLAEDFHSIDPASIQTLTLPTTSDGYVSPWGDVLFVDQPAAQQMLVSLFGSGLIAPTAPPPNTALEPSPPPVVVPTTTVPTTTLPGATTVPSTTAPTVPSFDPTPC